MLQRYETLILSIPEITNDESKAIEAAIEKTVKSTKGSVISYDRWGKYRLAYPIQKNDYGVYYLVRYELPEDSKTSFFDSIESLFTIKHADLVMRTMTVALNPTDSLEYERPESLEETPKDVESFLRKNKMEGLISKDNSGDAPAVSAAPEEKVVEVVKEEVVNDTNEKVSDAEEN
ncbi:30S ribosomal protein S6 [bacterium]|jgi:small subunit ribosomal protein S6|nr:30S ribosomal protein S6 [bacterium]MBT5015667.1 30S ribosomal protein S6 [bacterium]